MGNETVTADKRRPVRVFGLTESELEALRNLALKKYGKDSVSLLAKKLLQAQFVNGHLKVHHYGHLKVHHFKSGF